MPRRSRAGVNSASAASVAFVASSVLAPNCPEMVIKTPGRPMIVASPIFTAGAIVTLAMSESLTGRSSCTLTTVSEMARGSGEGGGVSIVMRCAVVSTTPPPRSAIAPLAAFMTSVTVRPRAESRSSFG